jgi:hypothetical protein
MAVAAKNLGYRHKAKDLLLPAIGLPEPVNRPLKGSIMPTKATD